jgi:putative DNA methylase
LIDDPSARPDLYPTQIDQDRERERLFELVARLAKWDALHDRNLLADAEEEVRRSTNGPIPPVLDPFCGRASIALEAQRLGLQGFTSDLNPVAVLIAKATTEVPARCHDKPPVNPDLLRLTGDRHAGWEGVSGLIEDLKYYGHRLRTDVAVRIGNLYPSIDAPSDRVLEPSVWLWARTVKCPNPACGAEMPLVSSFALSSKGARKTWVEPTVDRAAKTVDFEVRHGKGPPPDSPKVGIAKFRCLVCGEVPSEEYMKGEGMAGRMRARLLAVVAKDATKRFFLSPTDAQERAAELDLPSDPPDTEIARNSRYLTPPNWGLTRHVDLFSPRQVHALVAACHVVRALRDEVERDALNAGMEAGVPLTQGGNGAVAYADGIAMYLGLAIGRWADYSSTLTTWNPTNENVSHVFQRAVLPMVWDYAEANAIAGTLSLETAVGWVADGLLGVASGGPRVTVRQLDAVHAVDGLDGYLVSTDPPYYENMGYADLADYFYVWLRLALAPTFPDLFATVLTPKREELVAAPHRFGGDQHLADDHFEKGLQSSFERMRERHHPDFPMTVIYAFKQEESGSDGRVSKGWEAMLEGLLGAGLGVTGTWPMRTTKAARARARNSNALASAIVLACRPRPADAPMATRKEFVTALRQDLPAGLRNLQQGSVAPTDFAQAAIGPGMAVFSRYSKVVESDGSPMRVRTALALINEALDELLAEQEADFDADTRWCVAWFEQNGMNEGSFGAAETLSRAKNTAINRLVEAGLVHSRAGKVRLLDRTELNETWNPTLDARLTVWEVAQHLIRRHELGGEEAAAELLRHVGGGLAETARELAYRLFSICERKGWAQEARAYNALVTAWPEITRLTAQARGTRPGAQETMEV